MVPLLHPPGVQDGSTVVFVPVDGRLVFAICILLIVANLLWLAMWVSQGRRKFEERD